MSAEVTGVTSVDPDSNFFSLGGRGQKAMRLAAMIRSEHGTDLPTNLSLTHLAPRALAPLIVRHGEFDIRRTWQPKPRPPPFARSKTSMACGPTTFCP
jgi:hypothetical protein